MKLQRTRYAFGVITLNIISYIIISFFGSIVEKKDFWRNVMALNLDYKYIIFFSLINILYFIIVFGKLKKNIKQQKEEKKKAIEELKEMFQPLLMGEKINIIYDWYKTHKDDALKEYKRQLQLPIEEQSKKFNGTHTTRRGISNCFNQALKYYEKKYVSDEQLKETIAISHVRALLEKIEPLEKQIGENYNKPMFNFFRDLYKKEIE